MWLPAASQASNIGFSMDFRKWEELQGQPGLKNKAISSGLSTTDAAGH